MLLPGLACKANFTGRLAYATCNQRRNTKGRLMARKKVLLSKIFRNDGFASDTRRRGLEKLAEIAELEDYTGDLTADKVNGVIGVIADSALVHREFYEQGEDLRLIARWGVGFDKVQIDVATELGVAVAVTPVHMDTVAEYAIAQWMATLKRTYTLNRLSHRGDFSIIRTFEAQGSTLGLYGFGRIGQQVALRAKPLLGDTGRLLVYDIRPDIADLAAQFGAEAVEIRAGCSRNATPCRSTSPATTASSPGTCSAPCSPTPRSSTRRGETSSTTRR